MLLRTMGQILSLTLRLLVRYEHQLRWLLRRLTPSRYLGLHLTLGLLAAVGCLWLFGKIAEDFITHDILLSRQCSGICRGTCVTRAGGHHDLRFTAAVAARGNVACSVGRRGGP